MLWGHRRTHTRANNMPICHQKTHILISLSPKQLTRCDRFDVFRQHSPLMKPRDNDSYLVREPASSICQLVHPGIELSWVEAFLNTENNVHYVYLAVVWESAVYNLFCFLKQKQEQNDNAVKLRLHRRAMETSSPHRDGKHVRASPEKTLTVISVCHALYKAYVNTVSFKFAALRVCCGFTPDEITSATRQTQLSATHLLCQPANHQSHYRLPFYRKGFTDECWHQHQE